MKKTVISLIALGGVLVLLLIIYLNLSTNTNPEVTGVLYKIEEDGIAQIELTNEFGTFKFDKKENEWYVHSNKESYRASKPKMDLMQSALESFKIERVLDTQSEEYGFNNPTATVKVTDTKGNTYSFDVGNETASRASVYIKDKSGKAMVASASEVAQLTGSLQAYRTNEVFTVDTANIRNIKLFEQGSMLIDISNNSYKDWYITYPFNAPARKVVLTEFVSKLRNWQIAGYPKENLTEEQMGLNAPSSQIEITDEAGLTQKLFIGKEEGTQTYVQIGEGEVVMLYTTDLDFSTLTPEQVMYVAPLASPIDNVSAISVEYEGDVYEYNLDYTTKTPKVTQNGEEVPYEKFTAIYAKYITLNAKGYAPMQSGDNTPVAKLKTVLKDGSTLELTLTNKDADTLYMLIDGKKEFYLYKADLEELLYRIKN